MQPMHFLRRRTFMLNAVLGLLLVAGGLTAYLLLTSGKPAAATTVRTVAVAQGTVTATVSADGSVQSANSMTADFATPGQVTDIKVKVGDLVSAGQTIATVDPTDVQADLSAAKRNRTSASDALTRAEAGGNADAIANAQNQLDQANAAVAAAQRKVDGTYLKAPMAGTIVAINGAIGGSSNVQGGFIQLADLAHLQISASVPEADATRLKLGQVATVTWNALTDGRATGKVAAISPTAASGSNTVTYPITVSLDSAPAEAKLGQSVKLSITVDEVQDAIYVPSAAVRTAGNRTTVIVVRNGVQTTVAVQIGLKGDSFTVITDGLTVGEQVVLATVSSTTTNQNPFGVPGGGQFGGGGRGGNGRGN